MISNTTTVTQKKKKAPTRHDARLPGARNEEKNPATETTSSRGRTQLRSHARTNETNTISRFGLPPNLRYIGYIYIYIYIRYTNIYVLIYNRIIDMLMYTYTHSKSFIQLRSIDLRMLHYSMPQSTHGATSSPHLSGTYSASRGFRKDGIQRRVMALMLSETGTSNAYGAVRDWRAMPGNVLATTAIW